MLKSWSNSQRCKQLWVEVGHGKRWREKTADCRPIPVLLFVGNLGAAADQAPLFYTRTNTTQLSYYTQVQILFHCLFKISWSMLTVGLISKGTINIFNHSSKRCFFSWSVIFPFNFVSWITLQSGRGGGSVVFLQQTCFPLMWHWKSVCKN